MKSAKWATLCNHLANQVLCCKTPVPPREFILHMWQLAVELEGDMKLPIVSQKGNSR